MLSGILVTGSEGFIGSHAVKALEARDYVVRGYDISYAGLQDTYTPQILPEDNILDMYVLAKAVKQCNAKWIVHLAGQVFLTPSLKDPQHDAMTNIIGTLNVLEVARRNKCGVIFSSSGAVYGNNYQFPQPISPYGISKLTAENYCKLYHELYNVPIVVFRFSSVYGPGRKKTSVNLILDKALNEEVITVTGNGKQNRDFTHVSDIAEAISLACHGEFRSGVYDIGTGITTSINELIAIIERLLDKKVKVEYIPRNKADPKTNEMNVSKAAIYGFKAKVSLTQGLQQLIEEMK